MFRYAVICNRLSEYQSIPAPAKIEFANFMHHNDHASNEYLSLKGNCSVDIHVACEYHLIHNEIIEKSFLCFSKAFSGLSLAINHLASGYFI